MTDIIKQVVHFNREVLKIQDRHVGMLDSKEFHITCKSLDEELQEFKDSYDESIWGDMHQYDVAEAVAESADALIDNIYFAIGALYKHGMDEQMIAKAFTSVHEANMAKKLGVNAKRATGAADAVKPEGWKDPKLSIVEILLEKMNGHHSI